MRWTGSAMRVFALVAGVVLAVGATAPAGTAVGLAASDAGGREYEVQPGDTLWAIAGSRLGDPYRWPEIAAASASIVQPGGVRLSDPDLIRPEWTLALPGEPVDHGPVLVSGVSGATAVAAGEDHSCAVVVGGQVACWGGNDTGQLGYITTEDRSATPVLVSGVSGVTAVAAGTGFSCAVLTDGQITCWGDNWAAQLGGYTPYQESYTPVLVSEISGATSAAAGYLHACAVSSVSLDPSGLPPGLVLCWGTNDAGQLGDSTSSDEYRATYVGVSGATEVASSRDRSCAIIADGQVTCWGGDEEKDRPVLVPGVSEASAVAVGRGHACAVIAGGQVTCWGSNKYGQLGDGTTKARPTPVMASGLAGATALAASNGHSCAVIAGGKVACWGENEAGQLGDGTRLDRAAPVEVRGVTGATDVAVGAFHSCAVIAGGRVTCWGPTNDGNSATDSTAGDSPALCESGVQRQGILLAS